MLLSPSGLPPLWAEEAYRIGRHVATRYDEKRAEFAEPEVSYTLAGTLQLSASGWLLLNVPNALVQGVFSAMQEPGLELPPSDSDGRLNAHISVMSKKEVAAIGPDKISERGKQFRYTLGRFYAVNPDGWLDFDVVYMIRIHSPELQALRRSYGLSSLPGNGRKEFHITCAVRRRGVLGRNEKTKVPDEVVESGKAN